MYMCQALSYSLYIAKRTTEEPLINNDADREAHVILQRYLTFLTCLSIRLDIILNMSYCEWFFCQEQRTKQLLELLIFIV